ncbi:MAG: alanine/ornithine racemase family PLP-dependent enzyme [Lentimicrobiaceae bacterium]|nr:alanine/ornithine racemase family PLP-dependent enzyme [Lentimicrobiaceae bacterium]HPG33412.1 alanine/ornithine racemase family PLP-dependent enzyme [Lentimicrobium sp.]
MAYITLDRAKLKDNFNYLNKLFSHEGIMWAAVSKMLCGNRLFLQELINLGVKQLCDSRITNLRAIKKMSEEIETIYIKPPPARSIPELVKYADISFNTGLKTMKLISAEAVKQQKIHKVVIMIEMGELREGVMREDLIEFYEQVFTLPNIEIVGIGTNLNCLYGILPNHDKLIQLSLYKQLIEARFNKKIPYVSGGSSVSIPLIFEKLLPKGVNHFRVGETLFLGTDVYHDTTIPEMHNDVFRLFAEIIELIEKPTVPMGEMGTNVEGHSFDFSNDEVGKTSFRAILDLGLLDVESEHLKPVDKEIEFVGSSSDMIVIDLGKNEQKYKTGDLVEFQLDYMGTLRIMNSRYIEKRLS